MIIVGFYKGHNATAAILKDGEILAAASEERFNRVKNADVFPSKAIDYCMRAAGVKVEDVDYFVRCYQHPEGYVDASGKTHTPGILNILGTSAKIANRVLFKVPALSETIRSSYDVLSKYILTPRFQKAFKMNTSAFLKTNEEKFIFADHHLTHAYAAYYGFVPREKQKEDFLVITLDGEGDGICGSVSTVKNGKWKRIAETKGGNSIATFYGLITKYLGMKINEHEYKVMGLAPYVSQYEIDKIYPIFKGQFWTDDNLVMHSQIPSGSYLQYFDQHLLHKRFDGIAGAAQLYVEDVVIDLIAKAVKKTGIKNVCLGGGFFMNVKANKRISEMKQVKNLIICPSAGDESTVFGACYFGYEKLVREQKETFNPQTIDNLYLGPSYDDEDIEKALSSWKQKKVYKVKKEKNIEKKVAELIADGKIVGRVKGRMEWGARALGNRSIVMHPSRMDLKQELNNQVKSRDFWMPFAASVLEEYQDEYLVNPKNLEAQFMILALDTTDKGRKELAAAIHPSDFTCRPQIIKKDVNPDYHRLISYFKELTNIGAVLNTSYNYHGEPVVCTPQDALHTFDVTGMKYLALGSYLISKE